MAFEAWFTVVVVFAIFFGLLRNLAPPDLLFVVGTEVLMLAGVIAPKDAYDVEITNVCRLTLSPATGERFALWPDR